MAVTLKIEFLADHPEAFPILERWFRQERGPYFGADGSADAWADLRGACNPDAPPVAPVALCNGQLCGTAALRARSISTHDHLSSWLGALSVGLAFRRRGVAQRLIAGIEELARELGYARICAGTGQRPGTAETSLRRRGWTCIEKGTCLVSDVAIYEKAL